VRPDGKRYRHRAGWLLLAGTLALMAARPAPPAGAPLRVPEGRNLNVLLHNDDVAAHLVLRSGPEPRLLVAFPAGNSGVGLWLRPVSGGVQWHLIGDPVPVRSRDALGRPLRGIAFDVSAAATGLAIGQVVVGSVRMLRDYEATGSAPAVTAAKVQQAGATREWSRDRLDGAPGYRLRVELQDGQWEGATMRAGSDGQVRLHVEALTGEPPLTPMPAMALLGPQAANDPVAREALGFLAWREKFLAGSWRFNTYFGRDTLLSLRMLMPALQPEAVEAGIDSVLARLSSSGEVAHEEGIGDFAVLEHLLREGRRDPTPIYDYKMVDGDFLLAPVAAAWLLDAAAGRERAAAFLAAPVGAGGPVGVPARGAALLRNLRRVLASAAPFARDPQPRNLVALKQGQAVGNWRDSADGLGGGRYPYDVNAVLVPAALEAAGRLYRAHLLDRWLPAGDATELDRAADMAKAWQEHAPGLFEVEVGNAQAVAAIRRYAALAGVPPEPALRALGGEPLRWPALALDAQGSPVPVLHSDGGFALLFSEPSPAALAELVAPVMRPFPAGLMTDVGMLVANPAQAPASLQLRFLRTAYHGTVVWSWQQALLAAGLARQLSRADLPAHTRAMLHFAQAGIWRAIEATKALRSSELWSWRHVDGHYEAVAFGAAAGDADESNAVQLWSTVYLAVQPPAGEAHGASGIQALPSGRTLKFR
jgi:hypothetical protein